MTNPNSHYFIADDSLPDELSEFDYYYGAHHFRFTSNSGMFSPGHVDPASDLLMKQIPPISGTLLDMGCGYGPIGIVLSKVHGVTATLADVNSRALDFARKNCAANGVTADIVESDCFSAISGRFDTIAINPPIHAGKAVMYEMYERSFEHLAPGGVLYIVIQEKHGAKSSQKKLAEVFGSCEAIYKKKGYYILASRRGI